MERCCACKVGGTSAIPHNTWLQQRLGLQAEVQLHERVWSWFCSSGRWEEA